MVKITEELLQKADQIPNFSDGVIMPDGDYRLIEEKGHLQTMMALLPYPEQEIWKMIPENDSALFWMIEKTGCVPVSYTHLDVYKRQPLPCEGAPGRLYL